jgi:hypothetical protein
MYNLSHLFFFFFFFCWFIKRYLDMLIEIEPFKKREKETRTKVQMSTASGSEAIKKHITAHKSVLHQMFSCVYNHFDVPRFAARCSCSSGCSLVKGDVSCRAWIRVVKKRRAELEKQDRKDVTERVRGLRFTKLKTMQCRPYSEKTNKYSYIESI